MHLPRQTYRAQGRIPTGPCGRRSSQERWPKRCGMPRGRPSGRWSKAHRMLLLVLLLLVLLLVPAVRRASGSRWPTCNLGWACPSRHVGGCCTRLLPKRQKPAGCRGATGVTGWSCRRRAHAAASSTRLRRRRQGARKQLRSSKPKIRFVRSTWPGSLRVRQVRKA